MRIMVYKKLIGFGVNVNQYPNKSWGVNVDFWKWGIRTEFGGNK